MHVMTSSIPSTIPLNTAKTIQTPSSQVDSSLVSYALLLISNGFKSCLFFTGSLSIKLFIFGIIFHIFGFIRIYGSDMKSIHHSYLHIHQFLPISHPLPTLAIYPHGDTIHLVFSSPYDNISDISESINPHFRILKDLH